MSTSTTAASTLAPRSCFRPDRTGTYLYVFEGAVDIGDESVGYTESALVTDHSDVTVTATEDSTIVAFAINPDAPITRQGTIGR